jgi:hypothetical protein
MTESIAVNKPRQIAGGIHRIQVTGVDHELKFTEDGLDDAITVLTKRLDGFLWDYFSIVDHEAVFKNIDGAAVAARLFTFEVHPDAFALDKSNG